MSICISQHFFSKLLELGKYVDVFCDQILPKWLQVLMSFSIICLSSNISMIQIKKNYSGTRNIADNGKKYINTVSIRFFFH